MESGVTSGSVLRRTYPSLRPETEFSNSDDWHVKAKIRLVHNARGRRWDRYFLYDARLGPLGINWVKSRILMPNFYFRDWQILALLSPNPHKGSASGCWYWQDVVRECVGGVASCSMHDATRNRVIHVWPETLRDLGEFIEVKGKVEWPGVGGNVIWFRLPSRHLQAATKSAIPSRSPFTFRHCVMHTAFMFMAQYPRSNVR